MDDDNLIHIMTVSRMIHVAVGWTNIQLVSVPYCLVAGIELYIMANLWLICLRLHCRQITVGVANIYLPTKL